ncbi:mechanosensitive ion channel [Lacinutrix neustonica]|uniref:Mechanosensitive ion channel n=1 Tax=Lacinutrix neustonica TaxID=2980107 RepID=A0A9E8SE07_9FLAO|nr:mechanosensitive ion channel domain-containing protein [Lacinutrix neustonica]WAC02297.1 mechanosensitive ion channel [Lacinutrix neustonica]
MFLELYKIKLINTAVVLAVVIIVRILGKITIRKIGQKSGVNDARIKLISRYYTVTLFLIFVFVEAFVLGTDIKDISLMFSSVFAVIGIGLFAIWSILSNVTSGIIMFFSFPYKVGDKIKIHDKDYPIEAVIEDIRAFQLHLRVENGDLVTYPNNLILQKAVTLVEKDAIEDFGDFH